MKQTTLIDTVFAVNYDKVKEAFGKLQSLMPPYFFKSTSPEDLATIIQMTAELENKLGIQIIERSDRILAAYIKNDADNPPLSTGSYIAGKRILRTAIHESAPFNERGDVIVIEQMDKEVKDKAVQPLFSCDEIAKEYKRIFGTVPQELPEMFESLCWGDIADLDIERIVRRLHLAAQVRDKDYSITEFEKLNDNELRLTMAVAMLARAEGYYAQTTDLLRHYGFKVNRSYLRHFINGRAADDFRHKAVRINTFYITPIKADAASQENLTKLRRELNELAWSPRADLLEKYLQHPHNFCNASVNLMRAAAEFVHSQLSFVDRNAYTLSEIRRFMAGNPDILHRLVDAFESKFNPAGQSLIFTAEIDVVKQQINAINSGMPEKDAKVKTVLFAVTDFICNITKSNYFSENKTALAFAVNPKFMAHYESISDSYKNAFPPERPFGVFFFWRRNICGFQIRFSEIARGGWRTVVPKPLNNPLETDDAFEAARCEIFREGFVLANTQHKKNKDIYEGGSKMAALLKIQAGSDFKTTLWTAQRAIFEAFLQLINYDENGKLKDKNIVDYSGVVDIIEIGPDENMFDEMITWMGERAAESGYTLGSGIISGKVDTGINHKHYGVTSFGVYQYLMHTLKFIGIDPAKDKFTAKLSGGPRGDVAGNMLKLLNARNSSGEYIIPAVNIIALTDGPAAVYDPAGIDREELSRLIHCADLDSFNPECLHGDNAFIIYNSPDSSGNYKKITFFKNELHEDFISRDEFMKLFQTNICHEADVFIPCGGRPQTINENNYQLFAPNNRPSAKAIVEGANSFITPQARNILQDLGVVIIKDCSANKCGVITSSFEILSGLLLDEKELKEIKPLLVKEIMAKLELFANREAEWLLREFKADPQVRLTDLSDKLAAMINQYKNDYFEVLRKQPELATDKIIFNHLLPVFKEKYPERISRLPVSYRNAIVAVEGALQQVLNEKPSLAAQLKALDK